MVIKFYCSCGKKISIPDEHRNRQGKCPSCGSDALLKDCDPALIERDPIMRVDVDSSPSDMETQVIEHGVKINNNRADQKKGNETQKGTPVELPDADDTRVSDTPKNNFDEHGDTDVIDSGQINQRLSEMHADYFEEDADTRAVSASAVKQEVEKRSESGTETAGVEKNQKGRLIYNNPKTGEQEKFDLENNMIIGRDTQADITIMERGVSREHCKIIHSGNYIIKDCGSKNKVRVNGKPVNNKTLIKGDKILLGKAELFYME